MLLTRRGNANRTFGVRLFANVVGVDIQSA